MEAQQTVIRRNIQAYKLSYSNRFFHILPEGKSPNTQLIIQKDTKMLLQQPKSKQFEMKEQHTSIMVSLVLGIIEVLDHHYLAYATQVFYAGKYLQHLVYHIATVDFLPFQAKPKSAAARKKISEILTQMQTEIFSFGFYFSFTCDLTRTYRKILEGAPPVEEFFWNQHMLSCFKGVSKEWVVPVFQGYFSGFQSVLGNGRIDYYLFSRRSKHKSGTRFYARGLDDQAHCANSVETEQVLKLGEKVASHILYRGSVPIFWQQRSLGSKVKFTRTKQLTKSAFVSHLKDLHRKYGRILCINLLQMAKSDQMLLTRAFELLFSECYNELWQFCRYHYYDLHEVVKDNKPEQLNMFVHKRRAVLETFGYFMYNSKKEKVLTEQNGIVRVNCMDGLGRSNIMLMKIAFKAIQIILREQDIHLESIFGRELFDVIDSEDTNMFASQFRCVWAENCDFLSRMYCGTSSYSSSLTKMGKKGLLDFVDASLTSISRMYNSKFEDQLKQQSLDLILGRVTKTRAMTQDKLHNCPVNMFLVTWNINACKATEPKLSQLFKSLENAQIVVVAIQQMVPLNANNVLAEQQNSSAIQQWRLAIDAQLCKLGRYILVEKVNLVGLGMVVFVEESWTSAIKGVQKEIVKTGMGGSMGNKGAALIRLKIHDSTVCITNVHLEAGQKKAQIRVQNIVDIHQRAFQQNIPGVATQPKIQTSDFKFLIGDMNFRVELPPQQVRDVLKQANLLKHKGDHAAFYKLLDYLLKHDQLDNFRKNPECTVYLAAYNEAPISFIPTYKFDKQSSNYALKKNRVPSWCDRILLWSEFPFTQKLYDMVDLKDSDHKPVIAHYTLYLQKKGSPYKDFEQPNHNMTNVKEFRQSRFDFL